MIKVNQEFLDNFSLCMRHYECTEEEIIQAKAAVRADYENAARSYKEIANSIRAFPEVKEDEKYMLVSDMIFDKPKKEVNKVGGKKVVQKKVKAADAIKFKE